MTNELTSVKAITDESKINDLMNCLSESSKEYDILQSIDENLRNDFLSKLLKKYSDNLDKIQRKLPYLVSDLRILWLARDLDEDTDTKKNYAEKLGIDTQENINSINLVLDILREEEKKQQILKQKTLNQEIIDEDLFARETILLGILETLYD